jgi:hypothetical protein
MYIQKFEGFKNVETFDVRNCICPQQRWKEWLRLGRIYLLLFSKTLHYLLYDPNACDAK